MASFGGFVANGNGRHSGLNANSSASAQNNYRSSAHFHLPNTNTQHHRNNGFGVYNHNFQHYPQRVGDGSSITTSITAATSRNYTHLLNNNKDICDGSSITTAITAATSRNYTHLLNNNKDIFFSIFEKNEMGNLFHNPGGTTQNLPWIEITNNVKPDESREWAKKWVDAGFYVVWAGNPAEVQRAVDIYEGKAEPTEKDYDNFVKVAKYKCCKFKDELAAAWHQKLIGQAEALLPPQTYVAKSRHAPKGSKGHELSSDLTDAEAIGCHFAQLVEDAYKRSDKQGVEALLETAYTLTYAVSERAHDIWKQEVQRQFMKREFNGFNVDWQAKYNFFAPVIATVLESCRKTFLNVLKAKGIRIQQRCKESNTLEKKELVTSCMKKFIILFEEKVKHYRRVHDLEEDSISSIRRQACASITRGAASLQDDCHFDIDTTAFSVMDSLDPELLDAMVRLCNAKRQSEGGNLALDHRSSAEAHHGEALQGGGIIPQGLPTRAGNSNFLRNEQRFHPQFTLESPFRTESPFPNKTKTPVFSPLRSSPGAQSIASATATETLRELLEVDGATQTDDTGDVAFSEESRKKRQRQMMLCDDEVGGETQNYNVQRADLPSDDVDIGGGDEAAGGGPIENDEDTPTILPTNVNVEGQKESETDDAMEVEEVDDTQDPRTLMETDDNEGDLEAEDMKKNSWFLCGITSSGGKCNGCKARVDALYNFSNLTMNDRWDGCRECAETEEEGEKGEEDKDDCIGYMPLHPLNCSEGMFSKGMMNSVYLLKNQCKTRYRCHSGRCNFRVCQPCFELKPSHDVKCEFRESHEVSNATLKDEKGKLYFNYRNMIGKKKKNKQGLRTTNCSLCKKYFVPSDDINFPSDDSRSLSE